MCDAILKSQDFPKCPEQPSEDFELDEITKNLNEYYGKEKAEIDSVLLKMAMHSLGDDEWEI